LVQVLGNLGVVGGQCGRIEQETFGGLELSAGGEDHRLGVHDDRVGRVLLSGSTDQLSGLVELAELVEAPGQVIK
jgi:hypothetical protein